MTKNKGPSIYPVHSIKLVFEKGYQAIYIKTNCPMIKSFYFAVPENLEKKLGLKKRIKEMDWKIWDDVIISGNSKITAKYSRNLPSNYTSRGIIASQNLGQTLEILLREALDDKGYSITQRDGREYFEREKSK